MIIRQFMEIWEIQSQLPVFWNTIRDVKTDSVIEIERKTFTGQKGVLGIIGAGNFVSSTMLPVLKKIGANIKYIASSGGLSSTTLAKKYGIASSTTDFNEILKDKDTDLVVISTKHNSHALFCFGSYKSQKKCFCRKTTGH